eukprot:m.156908 g.156908  ORF g.156908 m.156908 type:complete len:192 (-) comp23642_c1_seq2:163-738(-)
MLVDDPAGLAIESSLPDTQRAAEPWRLQFQSWEIDSLPVYVGADVSSLVIKSARERFSFHKNKRFVQWDLVTCPLPRFVNATTGQQQSFDLVHMRDVIQHLPMKKATAMIRNILASGAKYFITTNHLRTKKNTDIAPGDYYHNNLELPPFNFPKPERCVSPKTRPQLPQSFCLWRVDAVIRNQNTTVKNAQ